MSKRGANRDPAKSLTNPVAELSLFCTGKRRPTDFGGARSANLNGSGNMAGDRSTFGRFRALSREWTDPGMARKLLFTLMGAPGQPSDSPEVFADLS